MASRTKIFLTAAAGIALAVSFTPVASAGRLSSTFQVGVNQLHDVSGELYLHGAGNTSGQVEAGDVLLSAFSIGKNNSTGANYGQGGTSPQLTGLYAVQVTSVASTSPVSNGKGTVPAV